MSALLRAAEIRAVCCEHGGVHIGLYSAAGELFATASMTTEVALNFAEDVNSAIETALALRQSAAAAAAGQQH